MMLQRIIPYFIFTSWLAAQTATVEVKHEKPKPAIEKLANGKFKKGLITFDQATREISFPATIEVTEGVIEYVLVNSKGKVHESLFLTDILPSNLNIVLKLLNYKESRELMPIIVNGRFSNQLHQVEDSIKKASRLSVWVTLGEGDTAKSHLINELITNLHTKQDMAPTPFVNGGSTIRHGKFSADINGDIIALLTDYTALLNYPGEDRMDDTLWTPHTKRLLDNGAKVIITLKPYNEPF